MHTTQLPRAWCLACLSLCGVLAACGDPIQAAGPDDVPDTPEAPVPAESTDNASADDGGAGDAGATYDDEAFVEVDKQQRDPFRNFTAEWVPPVPTEGAGGQRRRAELADVSVDDMRVIGIVLGAAPSRAMVVGPDGHGTAIRPRDYVGRPEYVQVGGAGDDGVQVRLNWRVDRIRHNEVILTRENPQAPDQPPLQRTLVLRSDDELDVMRLGAVSPLEDTAELPTP